MTIIDNYSLKLRWIVAEYSKSKYSARLKRTILYYHIHTRWQHNTFKKSASKQEFSVWPLLISGSQRIHGNDMRSQLAVSFPCAIFAWNLQFAQRWQLCKLHKNWQSSTMSFKADRTKLLFKKLLMPWSSSVKAVAVCLKLKEQSVKFSPEIVPAIFLLLEITIIF